MIELARARKLKEPKDTFLDLSSICVEHNILNQDTYGDFTLNKDQSWLRSFECEVAGDFGKDDGIFLPSGVMAQGIALVINSEKLKSNRFICHFSSHIILRENDAFQTLLSLDPIIVRADPNAIIQMPLSYEDIATLVAAGPKPSTIVIELPHREIGGKCTSWNDLVKTSNLCRFAGYITK
jgi:threonine aldolase